MTSCTHCWAFLVLVPVTSFSQNIQSQFVHVVEKDQAGVDVLADLVERGADVNGSTSEGIPLFFLALSIYSDGALAVAEFFVEHEVDLNRFAPGGYTPLSYAAMNYWDQDGLLVSFLIQHEVDVNADGGKAFHLEIIAGHLENVGLMIEKGMDLEVREGRRGYTGLISAIAFSHPEIALLLIENGCDLNAQDNAGVTSLMHALVKNNTDLIVKLVDLGVDLSVTDNEGNTAVAYAKNQQIAQYLEQNAP